MQPLQMPVSAQSDEITCAPREHETPLPAETIGCGWIRGVAFGLSLVYVQPLWLSDWGEVRPSIFRGRVCPEPPLTVFTTWEGLQRTRSKLEIDGVRLAAYQLNDAPGGGGALSTMVP